MPETIGHGLNVGGSGSVEGRILIRVGGGTNRLAPTDQDCGLLNVLGAWWP